MKTKKCNKEEIIALRKHGMLQKEIANKLGISLSSVQKYLESSKITKGADERDSFNKSLFYLYEHQKYSIDDISELTGLSFLKVNDRLRSYRLKHFGKRSNNRGDGASL